MSKAKQQKALYDQVKDILNGLQGNTVPNYQGLHAFWLNPDTFMTASLYGQRLIAPKEGEQTGSVMKSCCGSSAATTVTAPQAVIAATGSSTSFTDADFNLLSERKKLIPGSSKSPTVSLKNDIDCWPSGGGGGGSIPVTKRSDKSAIITGLKGQYPFDGSIFPRLLWDTDNVANADQVSIIAKWIDADCPLSLEEESQPASIAVQLKSGTTESINTLRDLAHGKQQHKISANNLNADETRQKGPLIRKEISSLSAEELGTFRDAIACMNQYNDYWQDERSFDFWARIHTDSCQHGWEQFLPWHRLYLYFFEQKLQDFNSNITLPYWSWADYADVNKTSFNNTHYDLGVVPEAYGCYLTGDGITRLTNAKDANGRALYSAAEIAALEDIARKGTVYQSGLRFLTAAGMKYEIVNENNAPAWSAKVNVLYNVLKEINPLWFPNRWPGSMGPLSLYPTKDGIDLILGINSFADFGGGPDYDHYYGALEKIHNGMHNFSGGTNPCFPGNNINGSKTPNTEWINIYKQLNLTVDPQSLKNPVYGWMTDNRITAFDPLFWGHHSNVDRIWSVWQETHTGTPQIMDGALAPWTLGVSDAMSIQKLGYSYMKDSVFYSVSNALPLVKFDSEPATVSTNTLQTHRKAEIKIHRMQRGNLPNARIRVFLNSPDANATTPTTGNDNFVEEIATFHGSCYGGPGHCSLPLPKTRVFDQRMLNHHEPRNYKIDASAAVQKLLNNGAQNITVQLVIVGINGEPAPDAVYIDGVSLNFMD